jgi:hypothetical protein
MVHRRPVAIVLLALLVLFAQGRAAVHELSHLRGCEKTRYFPALSIETR